MPYSATSLQPPVGLATSEALSGPHTTDTTNIKSLVESLVELGRRQESLIEAIAVAYKAGDKEKVFELAGKLIG